MKARSFIAALAGLFSVGLLTVTVHAALEVNAGGASAGTPFATDVPLSLCDASPAPKHYVNGPFGSPTITTGKIHVWECKRGGVDVIFRYSATGSADGIRKVTPPLGDAASKMSFLNAPTDLAGCVGPTNLVRPSDGKAYQEFTGCTSGPVLLSVHVGWSDVHGSSFHQTGPVTSSVTPIDQSSLISTQVAIVPFDMVLGNGVVAVSGGTVAGPVNSLSRLQVESLFSGNVTDWRQLGLGTAPVGGSGEMAAGGTPVDATSPVTICMRTAGSGTKAALDETVLKDAVETAIGSTNLTLAADGKYFGQSNQDIRDCIRGNPAASRPAHPHGVGYMEGDQADAAVGLGGMYIVKLNGYRSRDISFPDPKDNVKCGKHYYWVGERFNTRNPADPDPAVNQLIEDYRTVSADPATIAIVPAGNWWVAPSQMNVSKNQDAGPLSFKAAPVPATCKFNP